jgi:glycerol kinase
VSILVVDVGTTGLRAAVVRPDATVTAVHYRKMPPTTPFPGLVEVDGSAMAGAVLEVARAALAEAGPVQAVGIANQRATTLVWDRATGEPVGPGLGWQDLRTLMDCLTLQTQGLRFAPNQSATKLTWLLDSLGDGGRDRDLCFGTVDTWVAWTLSGGSVHVTDPTNAAVTGMLRGDATAWDERVLQILRVPPTMMPSLVDSTGVFGEASELDGAPPLAGLAGDQQASLLGQGCVRPGLGKITFGSGAMLDLCTGGQPPVSAARAEHGTFPIVAWRRDGSLTWGVEAIMLSAGTNVEWLVDDLGLLVSAADSDVVAASCDDTGGVVYVPALLGLGTPAWDFGARGTLLGLTRGTGRAEVVRAVLEGVAHRGADLVEAAEADTGATIPTLRVDGGMSANQTFLRALAAASGRPVEVSPVLEATTLGAAYLAGLAVGTWGGLDDIAAAWHPRQIVEPGAPLDRDRWTEAVRRARGWIPELSTLDF